MKKFRILLMAMTLFIAGMTLAGCGAMTAKDMDKVNDWYEEGKVGDTYYYEALDAYQNGDPLPPRTFIGRIWRGITNAISSFVGMIKGIIALVIVMAILIIVFGRKGE